MITEAFDLAHEFPEFKEAIHHLKVEDQHFARLFDDYTKVSKEIHRIEAGIENVADDYAEDLKKQRLQLKDSLYAMLKKAG